MNGTENLTETTSQSGDANIGSLYRFMLLHTLTVYEQVVFMQIGRYSLGYKRKNTNVPMDRGYNRNSKAWADDLNISKTSFLKAVKSLVKADLISIHTGSVYRKDGGSYPDYYSIKYNADLQKKHHIYFDTAGLPNKLSGTKSDIAPTLPKPPVGVTHIEDLVTWDSDGQITSTGNKFIIKSRKNTHRNLTIAEYVAHLTENMTDDNNTQVTAYINKLKEQ